MAKRYYRPELDALRFFAFACVFLDHQDSNRPWLQQIIDTGEFGMCIFFMLSAYLIVTILLREKDATGTVSWKAFAARRILRIWPLYFAILFLAYWLAHYWPAAPMSRRALIEFSFLLGNVCILHHGWTVGVVKPLWSISVEEQFYLAIPTIARASGRRTLAGICVATLLFAYIVLFWLGARHAIPVTDVWVNSFVQFQFFAAGGLVAIWRHERLLNLSAVARCSLFIGGLCLWHFATLGFHLRSTAPSGSKQLVGGYLLVLAGTIMIFLAALDMGAHIPAPVIYLGKISYGLYLFHEPFIYLILVTSDIWPRMAYFQHHKEIAVPLIFALTVATAALSYHFFERPILKFKERFETVKTRPA